MSWISDPDRLERIAHYVMDDPPQVLPREVADVLNDAAERIRSLQARLAEALVGFHAVAYDVLTPDNLTDKALDP